MEMMMEKGEKNGHPETVIINVYNNFNIMITSRLASRSFELLWSVGSVA